MRKSLIIPGLLGASILLTGCETQNNLDNTDASLNIQKSEICSDNKGTLTNRTEGGDITVCAFDDGSFCFLEDLEGGTCEKGLIFFEIDKEINDSESTELNEVSESENIECDELEQNIVCGKDGNTYQNECYLNKAGVAQEVELAHVENGECVFE